MSSTFKGRSWLLAIVPLLQACQQAAPPQKPPQMVEVVTIEPSVVPIFREYIGEVYGKKDVSVRARVEGFLEGIYFLEGSNVSQGDLLYRIDPQSLEADEAAKSSKLAAARSDLANAKAEYERIKPLAEINAVSQSELDAARTKVEVAEASVRAAQAGLRSSSIQLGYTEVRAPISGLIGQTNAKVGEFVGRDPNPVILNTISRIDTVRVQFFITEQEYLAVRRAREGLSDVDTLPENEKLELELILSDGSVHPAKGFVDFLDRQVNPATGSMAVQASFPNPREVIRPGQFVRVRALVRTIHKGMQIPQRAVREIQGKYQVWVMTDSSTVQPRFVEVGKARDGFWLIESGLSFGDKVVVSGIQKLAPGALVQVKPDSSATPKKD